MSYNYVATTGWTRSRVAVNIYIMLTVTLLLTHPVYCTHVVSLVQLCRKYSHFNYIG